MQPTSMPSISDTVRTNRMKKNKSVLFCLGTFEICIGLACCVMGVSTMGARQDCNYYTRIYHGHCNFYLSSFPNIGQGIWSGFTVLICGIMGLVAQYKTAKCVFQANLFLSVLSALVMVMLLLISCIAAASGNQYVGYHITLAVVGFLGAIIASCHATYANFSGSSRRKHERRVVYTTAPQQQVSRTHVSGIPAPEEQMVPMQMTNVPVMQQRIVPVQMPNGQVMFHPAQAFYPVGPNLYSTTQPSVPLAGPPQSLPPVNPTNPGSSQDGVYFSSVPTSNMPVSSIPSIFPASQHLQASSSQQDASPEYPQGNNAGNSKKLSTALPNQPVTEMKNSTSSVEDEDGSPPPYDDHSNLIG